MAGQPRDKMLPAGFSSKDLPPALKWADSPAAKAKTDAAEKRAWAQFTNQSVSERGQGPVHGTNIC